MGPQCNRCALYWHTRTATFRYQVPETSHATLIVIAHRLDNTDALTGLTFRVWTIEELSAQPVSKQVCFRRTHRM